MGQFMNTKYQQLAVAALLGGSSRKFLFVITRVEDLCSEATFNAIPAITCNDLPHLHQLEDISGQQLECPVHIAVALSRRLDVADSQIGGKLLGLIPAHLAVLVEVALVADENVDHVVGQDVLAHLLVPFSHMVKGLAVGEVKD